MNNKIAIVTGGGRGIGRAICLRLGQAGMHVIAAARTQAEIDEVAAEIVRAGGKAAAIALDLTSEESIVELFRQVRERFGRLDVLVNNAGIGLYGQVAEFTAEAFDKVLSVNLRGAFICCREAMRVMIPQRSGCIINVSSVVGIKGYPNQAAYTASKHGMVGLTKSLAAEAQPHGVRVSVVLPGGVDTDMVAKARPDLDRSVLLQPDDVADVVMFLLSLSDRAAIDEIYLRRRASQPF